MISSSKFVLQKEYSKVGTFKQNSFCNYVKARKWYSLNLNSEPCLVFCKANLYNFQGPGLALKIYQHGAYLLLVN